MRLSNQFKYEYRAPERLPRADSFKRILLEWAARKGTFTKAEFLQAHDRLADQVGHVSVMGDKAGLAWFSELLNKAKVFVLVSDSLDVDYDV